MNRIVFVNRYYRPDHSATAQLLTDLAERLAAHGVPVVVVSSRQCYDDPQRPLCAREQLGGVEIHRVWTSRFGRANLLGRAFDYLSFYLSSFLHLMACVRPGDVLVVKTDPPMISVIGAIVARVKGATLVNWLQDLFPEVARELGVSIMKPPLHGLLKKIRNWSLNSARHNVVLGDLMAQRVNAETGRPDKTVIIPNWVVQPDIRAVASDDNPLRDEWALQHKFVVGYSGNLGRAHEFGTILEAALLLKDEPDLQFLFIGAGAQLAPVREFVERHALSHVTFKNYQPLEQLAYSLSAADLHLVSLQPGLEGLIVPSKFYGIVAVGRPLAFIGAADGELGRLIAGHECGATVAPGDAEALARFIAELKTNPREHARLAENSRRLAQIHLNRDTSLGAWQELLA